MAILTCENHRNLRWRCKDIAVNSNGRYNGKRRVTFFGVENDEDDFSILDNGKIVEECDCPASELILLRR